MHNVKNIKLKCFSFFLFFLLIIPSFSFANDINLIFHVTNNLMVDVYYNIFNGLAMLLQDDVYLSILKVVFLLGGFFVFMLGIMKVFSGGDAKAPIFDFLKYMIIGTIMLSVLFHSKKTTILIQSDEIPTYCHSKHEGSVLDFVNAVNVADANGQVLVGNIPDVLATSYVLMNRIGRDMTELASNYFSLPGGFKPPMNGFASFLAPIGETLSLNFDKIVANDTDVNSSKFPYLANTIVQECILTSAAQDSTYGSDVISVIKNTGFPIMTIHELIQNGNLIKYKNPDDTNGTTIATNVTANGTEYKNILVTFFGKTYNCGDLENQLYSVYTDTSKLDVSCIPGSISKYMTPKALAILVGKTNSNLPGPNRFREVAVNAAMMNTIYNSANKLGLGSLYYTQGKTIAEFVQSSLGSGYYMAQLLPFMQMALRAILYAFFPFVFIVALFPGGLKVLLSYAQTVLWIELWAPTAAILNFFLSYVSASDFQSMYRSGFNAVNATQVFSDSAILASVAGYLYASVPALTWLILKGSGYMLGNVTGAIASRFSANLSNVDAYNKDIAEVKQLSSANKERLMKGQKIVSLAEMNALSTQMAQREEYAKALALSEFKDHDVYSARYGDVASNIAVGKGRSQVYINKDNINLKSNATEIEELKNIKGADKLVDYIQKTTGVSKDRAVEIAGNMLSNHKFKQMFEEYAQRGFGNLTEEEYQKLDKGIDNLLQKEIGAKMEMANFRKKESRDAGAANTDKDMYESKVFSTYLKEGAKLHNIKDKYKYINYYAIETGIMKALKEMQDHTTEQTKYDLKRDVSKGLIEAALHGEGLSQNEIGNINNKINRIAHVENTNLNKSLSSVATTREGMVSFAKELNKLSDNLGGVHIKIDGKDMLLTEATDKLLTMLESSDKREISEEAFKLYGQIKEKVNAYKEAISAAETVEKVNQNYDSVQVYDSLAKLGGKEQKIKSWAKAAADYYDKNPEFKKIVDEKFKKLDSSVKVKFKNAKDFLQKISSGENIDQQDMAAAFNMEATVMPELKEKPELFNAIAKRAETIMIGKNPEQYGARMGAILKFNSWGKGHLFELLDEELHNVFSGNPEAYEKYSTKIFTAIAGMKEFNSLTKNMGQLLNTFGLKPKSKEYKKLEKVLRRIEDKLHSS